MPSKIYSYQSSLVQAIVVGQSAGTEILYKTVIPSHYTYPSTSQQVHLLSIFKLLWLSTMDSTNKSPIRKTDRRHYLYESLSPTAPFLEKKGIGWLSTMDSTDKLSYIPTKNKFKWSTYPSYFMMIKTIPTKKTVWADHGEISKDWIEQPEVK